MTTLDIEKMTVPERMQTMERIWDSLTKPQHEMESPQWHIDVLDQRKKMIEDGSAEFITLDELAHRNK
jgi:putative addiction module component (TIGR02574 family)